MEMPTTIAVQVLLLDCTANVSIRRERNDKNLYPFE